MRWAAVGLLTSLAAWAIPPAVPAAYLSQPLVLQVHAGDEAHLLATGKGTVVAVIDTGVDQFNPVLQGVLLPSGYNFYDHTANWSEFADLRQAPCPDLPQAAGATAARLQEAEAVPVANDDTTPSVLMALHGILACNPEFGHGTAVAGLIHLVAPEAMILPLKAFGPNPAAEASAIAAALNYAMARHVDVINLSFSAAATTPGIRAAMAEAIAKGIVVVAAAGNSASSTEVFPAALEGVIGVGAVDGQAWNSLFPLASFSNFSPPAGILDADVAAPGVDLFTTFPGFGRVWARVSGTSFSAPLVAGEAALLAQLGAHGARARALIENSSDPAIAGDLRGELGHGLIQVLAALRLFHQ